MKIMHITLGYTIVVLFIFILIIFNCNTTTSKQSNISNLRKNSLRKPIPPLYNPWPTYGGNSKWSYSTSRDVISGSPGSIRTVGNMNLPEAFKTQLCPTLIGGTTVILTTNIIGLPSFIIGYNANLLQAEKPPTLHQVWNYTAGSSAGCGVITTTNKFIFPLYEYHEGQREQPVKFLALDETSGHPLWNTTSSMNCTLDEFRYGALVHFNQSFFFVCSSTSNSSHVGVYAFDESNGSLNWKLQLWGARGPVAVSQVAGVAAVAHLKEEEEGIHIYDVYVNVLDVNSGKIIWTTSVVKNCRGKSCREVFPMLDDDNNVLIMTVKDTTFTFSLDKGELLCSLGGDIVSGPAVNGTVVVSTPDKQFRLVNTKTCASVTPKRTLSFNNHMIADANYYYAATSDSSVLILNSSFVITRELFLNDNELFNEGPFLAFGTEVVLLTTRDTGSVVVIASLENDHGLLCAMIVVVTSLAIMLKVYRYPMSDSALRRLLEDGSRGMYGGGRINDVSNGEGSESRSSLAASTYSWKSTYNSVDSVVRKVSDELWYIDAEELVLHDIVGRGGEGVVYKAMWQGIEVALKTTSGFIPGVPDATEGVEMFAREIRMLSQLRHPNVILFLGGSINTSTFGFGIVMEYCRKGSLYQLVHDEGEKLEWGVLVKVIKGIVHGMTYLHSNHILHRDLKSPNVLLLQDFTPKISDFGLSRYAPRIDSKLTMQVGTPIWMAPEIINERPYTEKADVYSFSIILWELLTRQSPYENVPTLHIASKVATGFRPPIPHFCPSSLRCLILVCWQEDPALRPSFATISEKWMDKITSDIPDVELPMPSPSPSVSREWRRVLREGPLSSSPSYSMYDDEYTEASINNKEIKKRKNSKEGNKKGKEKEKGEEKEKKEEGEEEKEEVEEIEEKEERKEKEEDIEEKEEEIEEDIEEKGEEKGEETEEGEDIEEAIEEKEDGKEKEEDIEKIKEVKKMEE